MFSCLQIRPPKSPGTRVCINYRRQHTKPASPSFVVNSWFEKKNPVIFPPRQKVWLLFWQGRPGIAQRYALGLTRSWMRPAPSSPAAMMAPTICMPSPRLWPSNSSPRHHGDVPCAVVRPPIVESALAEPQSTSIEASSKNITKSQKIQALMPSRYKP